jgi:recombination associated protein RdgC
MWFKNLQLYRLPRNWAAEAAPLEEQLARMTLQGCSATDPRSIGWVSPRDGSSLIHVRQSAVAAGARRRGKAAAGFDRQALC